MQYHSANIPRLEYFHHQFDKISTRFTDMERRLNDINQKMESTKVALQKLEFSLQSKVAKESSQTKLMRKEIKEIKTLLQESQAYQARIRKLRLPL